MWNKRTKIFSVVIITLCLILLAGVLPVSANSNQGSIPTLAPPLAVPPPNFNPLTATDQELQQYGFPSRPSDAKELQEWENVMQYAKQYVKPDQHPSSFIHGLVRTSTSSHWAGYVVNGTDNKINGNAPLYTQATGEWTQPTYSGTNAVASLWVGMGGWTGSSSIVQAGADSNVPGSTKYEFWVEDAPAGTVWEATPVVNAGNILYVDVQYGGSTSTAFLLNSSTTQYTTVSFNTPNYDGKSADYIYEAINYPPYPSWGSSAFSSCLLSSNLFGITDFDSFGYEQINMKSGSTLHGWPSTSPSNASFTMYSK